jgi:hypothetical protein
MDGRFRACSAAKTREQERDRRSRDERFRGGVWSAAPHHDAKRFPRWFDYAMLRIAALTVTSLPICGKDPMR